MNQAHSRKIKVHFKAETSSGRKTSQSTEVCDILALPPLRERHPRPQVLLRVQVQNHMVDSKNAYRRN